MIFPFDQLEIDTVRITVSEDDGPLDLTPYDVEIWIDGRPAKTEGDGVTIIDAEGGILEVFIDAEDTETRGRFPVDIWLIDDGVRERVVKGILTVTGTVRGGVDD